MARYYVVNGRRIDASASPYTPGSDQYYRWLSQQVAAAKGEKYEKSQRLIDLERGLEADKLATDESRREQDWQDAHKSNEEEYKRLMAEYLHGQSQWDQDIADLARQRDRGLQGRAVKGYHQVTDPATGQSWWEYAGPEYDEGDDDTSNDWAGSVTAATALGVEQARQGMLGGKGKFGAAGNANPAGPIDNSWNDADGLDVRTDEQKFYDRNLGGIAQQADAEGRYSWYADEDYTDEQTGEKKKRRINLSELASRETAPADVDAGKGPGGNFKKDQFWNYNGGSGNSSWFDEQIRNRANRSIYARTV